MNLWEMVAQKWSQILIEDVKIMQLVKKQTEKQIRAAKNNTRPVPSIRDAIFCGRDEDEDF